MAGVIQVNGTRGEITPYLHSRIDLDIYQAGFRLARNWVSLRFGGMTRLPGTIFMGYQRNGATTDARFLPFRFNVEQTYVIEATPLLFRFWNRLGRIENPPGTPVAVVTPYTIDDLPFLQTRQIGDLVYITCKGKEAKVLTRLSETSWTLTDYVSQDGPFLPINTTGTTLEPAARGSYLPQMTGNALPAPNVVASSDASGDAWEAFDLNPDTIYNGSTTSGWLSANNGASNVAVDAYYIKVGAEDNTAELDFPINWTFEGYNGSDWIVLDTRQGETGWVKGERRYYSFVNENDYDAYRLKWSGVNGGIVTRIAELGMHVRAEDQTAFALTASSITGINDNTGFQPSDVGRAIRLRGSDGLWRWARIVTRSSTTVVTVRLYGHALVDLSPIQAWRMSLWGDEPGFPTAIGIHEDRLVFAGYPEDPTGLVASVNADYDNFTVSAPVVDDDAVSARMSGGELNAITWIADGPDMVVGTEGSIRAVGRNENARAFAPGNVRQRTETEVTTSYITPIKVENMLLALDSYRSRIYEVGYDDSIQGYMARELSALNEHLVGKGIRSWGYQANPHKIIWATTDEGTLLAAVYDRAEKVFGVTECTLDGDGDATVEEIMVLPGDTKDGDHVFMTVKRTINGTVFRHVERLSSFYREGYSEQEHPIYGHCAGVYEGVATNTVTGITYLANTIVGVWADGRDLGDALISLTGVLTLPLEITATKIIWGLRYNSRLETLRLASLGPQSGPHIGQRVNIVGALIDYYQTSALSAGTLNSVMPLRIEADQEVDPFAAAVLRSDAYWIGMDDSWENNGVCVIETNSMHPATVLSITAFPEGEP